MGSYPPENVPSTVPPARPNENINTEPKPEFSKTETVSQTYQSISKFR